MPAAVSEIEFMPSGVLGFTQIGLFCIMDL